jgi:hypothetical protein
MLFDGVMNLALLRATTEGTDIGDVFDPDGTAAFLAWLREPVAADGDLAVNRYLFEAYRARPDVQAEYPEVPGADVGRLLDWGWVSGRREMGMAGQLLPPPTAAAAALRPPRQSRVSRFAAGVSTRTGDWLDVATRGRIPRLAARRESRLQDISRDSAEAYRAGPYRGRITLLRSEEFLGDIEIARWYGVASGGVDERLVRGTHRSMVREPDVVSLAESLEGCIDATLDVGE